MYGISNVNIELTSRCNKGCWMCGRRKLEREQPEKCNWGDMPFEMVEALSKEIPKGVFVQFHWNGEPTLYPQLGSALALFKHHNTGFDTNGRLLVEKYDSIIDNVDTLTISVIQDDPEATEQFETVMKFLEIKGARKPLVTFRILGNVLDSAWKVLAKHHDCMIATRTLHSPDMSKDYEKPVTIPETGVCQEILHKLAIDRFGNVSPCVRYDPDGLNIISNISKRSLYSIWNSKTRQDCVKAHIEGRREDVPICGSCQYFGCPVA